MDTQIHTYIHTYMYTYIAYIHTYIHTYITYMHVYIHTYVRMYIHGRFKQAPNEEPKPSNIIRLKPTHGTTPRRVCETHQQKPSAEFTRGFAITMP